MADAQLQVVIKARNDAKKAFGELSGQVKGLQGSGGFGGLNDKIGAFGDKFKSITGISLGFATAAGAAGAAVMGLGKFLSDSVNETVAYATEIDNMSRLLGISTEDTSRLVQASDDLFVSQETLKSGLQAATRQGIDVSIEGLKKLSEQYLALPPGVERSEFVLKTFGRSGAEMGKLMEVGAEGIEAATAAIADNLVITEQSMKETIRYKQSVDNLNDSWQGFKYTVGQAAIPALDLLLRNLTKGTDEIEATAEKTKSLTREIENLEGWLEAGGKASDKTTDKLALLKAQLAWVTGEFEKGEAGVSDFYAGISAMGGVVIPLTGELEGLGSAASEVSQYFSEMTANMMFNKLAATMDVDAAMALGEAMGLVNSETVFLSGEIEGLNAKYETNGQKGLQAAEMTKEYYQEVATLLGLIEGAKSKTIVLTVRTFLDDQQGLFGQGPNNGYIGLSEGNRAIGGPVSANTPYVVGEVGPELFVPNTSGTIIPNNKLSSGGGSAGGVTNIYFTYAPALSLSDRAEFEGRVIPMMKRLMAKAG